MGARLNSLKSEEEQTVGGNDILDGGYRKLSSKDKPFTDIVYCIMLSVIG